MCPIASGPSSLHWLELQTEAAETRPLMHSRNSVCGGYLWSLSLPPLLCPVSALTSVELKGASGYFFILVPILLRLGLFSWSLSLHPGPPNLFVAHLSQSMSPAAGLEGTERWEWRQMGLVKAPHLGRYLGCWHTGLGEAV